MFFDIYYHYHSNIRRLVFDPRIMFIFILKCNYFSMIRFDMPVCKFNLTDFNRYVLQQKIRIYFLF